MSPLPPRTHACRRRVRGLTAAAIGYALMNTDASPTRSSLVLDAVATGALSCASTLVLALHPYVREFTCGCPPLAPVFKCVSGCALAAVLVLWCVCVVWGQSECSEGPVWLVRWHRVLPSNPFHSSEILALLTNWRRSLLRLPPSYWQIVLDLARI